MVRLVILVASRANAQGKLIAKSIKDMLPQEERVFNDVWQIASTAQGVYFSH